MMAQALTQSLANSLVAGVHLAALALVFAWYHRIAGFYNVSLAALVTAGAYGSVAAAAVTSGRGFALLVAGMVAAFGGCALEAVLFTRLRLARSPLISLLASLAVMSGAQNVIAIAFGDARRVLEQTLPLHFWSFVFTSGQLLQFAVGSLILVGAAFGGSTPTGLKLRAIASDSLLSRTYGIDVRRLVLLMSAAAGVVCGLVGATVVFDTAAAPTMGFRLTILAAAAYLMADSIAVTRVATSAVSLTILSTAATWLFSSAWSEPVAIIIACVLAFSRAALRQRRLQYG